MFDSPLLQELLFSFFFSRLYSKLYNVQILILLIIGNRDALDPVRDKFPSGRQIFLLLRDLD